MILEKELVIPAGKGAAFTADKGQICRVIALEGEQCLDAVFLNARDHRERFHTFFSYSFNCKQGTGNAFHCKTLYSGPPWERPMMSVLEDTVKRHFVLCSGRCSPMIYRLRDNAEGHPNYMDLRAEIDILCAISACPDDLSICNNHKPKPVGVKIFRN